MVGFISGVSGFVPLAVLSELVKTTRTQKKHSERTDVVAEYSTRVLATFTGAQSRPRLHKSPSGGSQTGVSGFCPSQLFCAGTRDPTRRKNNSNTRGLSQSALPLPGQLSRTHRRNYEHGKQSAHAYTASKRYQTRPRPGCIVFFGGFGRNGGFGAEIKELLRIGIYSGCRLTITR